MRYCEELYSVQEAKKRKRKFRLLCIPNENFCTLKEKIRGYKWRKRTGYAYAEIFSLDYTSYVWLYEHIKLMLEESYIDWDYKDWAGEDTRKELDAEGMTEEEYPSLRSVLNYITDTIYEADKMANEEIDYKKENIAIKMIQRAFRIYSIVMPYCWT